MKAGWIYALRSDNTPYVKIGLTTTSPFQRIREINGDVVYGALGPWQQLHLKQVRDTRTIETTLHRRLADKRITTIESARELFSISSQEARDQLDAIPDADLAAPTPVNNLRLNPDFIAYLISLFQYSGLGNYRHLQEAWTFSLFPSTGGGRYFTINIDRHEVACSKPIAHDAGLVHHAITVDQMAMRDPELKKWLKGVGGRIQKSQYTSNWGNASEISFQCNFDSTLGLFALTGFRRALIAYWYEALLRMQDRGTKSLFARFHNYDAVSEIFRHLNETQTFRSTKVVHRSE